MTTRRAARRIEIAETNGLVNVEEAWAASRQTELPFAVACALLEKESGGRNVWGNDAGGVFAELDDTFEVTQDTFEVFEFLVCRLGRTSNGVGPCQITYAGPRRSDGTRDGGFFRLMRQQGLDPWEPVDNMLFGFDLLRDYAADNTLDSWRYAGTRYNGASSYGDDLVRKIVEWRKRLRS